MALSVGVWRLSQLPGHGERQVHLSFRGFTQKTRKVCCGPEAIFKELFRWPHYGKLVMGKMLSIKVYNCSKVFSNRLLGTLVLSLQHLMTSGRLILCESLVDKSNRVTDIYIELDLRYQPPNSSAGSWVEEDFVYLMKDSSELIIHNPGFEQLEAAEWLRMKELDKKAAALGRKLAKGLETEEEEEEEEDFYDTSDFEASGIIFSPVKSRSRLCSARDLFAIPMPQSFQVGINVIEAQKLVGVNINPFVVVKVGEEKRHMATQKSTNCPFYNEYFLFDFYEPRDILLHRLIEISTLHGPLNGIQLQAIIQQLFNVLWALIANVWDPSHFGTCAVVGNSGQLKEASHGLLIDAHDWVLTFEKASPQNMIPLQNKTADPGD